MIRIEDNNDVLYINKSGGIDQLDPLKDAEKYVVNINEKLELPTNSEENQLNSVLMKLLDFFRYYHITFLEVNPLAITKNGFIPLDFAVLIDDCSFYLFDQEDKQLLEMEYFNDNNYEAEAYIHNLDLQTGGSLKFKMLNPKGTVWTMVAGGGASVVYTDAIVNYFIFIFFKISYF